MYYIIGQIFPLQTGIKKDEIATWLHLSRIDFLSPPTFWEARDQPEPESFFWKTFNNNDLNQVADQRFSLKQWLAAGAHYCRLRKTDSAQS